MSKHYVPTLIVAMALILTACGDSGTDARTSSVSASEPAATPAPAPVAEPTAPAPANGSPAAAPAPPENPPTPAPAPAPILQDGKRPFKLGVVNLKICFDRTKHDRIKDVDVELQGMAQDLTQRVKELEQKQSIAKQKLDALDRTKQPRLWEDKRRELAVAQTQLKFEKELGRALYVSFYNDKKIEVYNEVRKIVSQIAQEKGFDLVLRVEEAMLEDMEQTAPVSITQRINNRVVLYHDQGVDITDLVVARLNEDYRKQKGSGSNK